MANLTGFGQVYAGNSTTVDSSAVTKVGTVAFDTDNNEYIYLLGVISTVAGSWVTYNPYTGVTALLAADAIGPVAIAQAAIVAGKYGWYLIGGTYASATCTSVTGAVPLYIDSTPGNVDDTGVSGDCVFGAVSTGSSVAGVVPVKISYPFVENGAYLT